jgi:ribosome assembly protein YihI (activator of Der GTPase)
MSKKSKTRARDKRKKDKATKKAAMRSLYESYMAQGKNKKKKKDKNGLGITARHVVANCGNIGCKKCHPAIFAATKRKPNGCNYDPAY